MTLTNKYYRCQALGEKEFLEHMGPDTSKLAFQN